MRLGALAGTQATIGQSGLITQERTQHSGQAARPLLPVIKNARVTHDFHIRGSAVDYYTVAGRHGLEQYRVGSTHFGAQYYHPRVAHELTISVAKYIPRKEDVR